MIPRASAFFARFAARSALRRPPITPIPVAVYPIRYVRKPIWQIIRKIAVVGAATAMAFTVLQGIALAPLIKAIEEQLKSLPPDELKRLLRSSRERDSGFRIPIPWTLTYLPPRPYDHNGPEWKEFLRISRDIPRMNSIVDDVKESIQKALLRSLNGSLGKATSVRHWIGLEFPHLPTQGKWVQTEWAAGVGLRERVLPWAAGVIWWKVEHPWTFMEAFYRYYTTLGKTSLGSVRDSFSELLPGFGADQPTPSEVMDKLGQHIRAETLQVMENQQNSKPSSAPGIQPSNGKTDQAASPTPAMKTSSRPASSSSNPSPASGREASRLSNKQSSSPNKSPDLERMIGKPLAWFYQHSGRARAEFWNTINRQWNLPARVDFNGCIQVAGPMHLQCEHGYWLVYINALWDPKAEAIVFSKVETKKYYSYRKPPTGWMPPVKLINIW